MAVLNVSDPAKSDTFNPLWRVGRSHTEVQQIASVLVDAAFPNSRGDRFWNDSAKALIATCIHSLKSCQPQFQTLGNVRHLLNSCGPNRSGLDAFISNTADAATFSAFKAFRASPERVAGSIIATARTALEAFADPALCEISSSDTLQLGTLRRRLTVVYMITPEAKADFYSFWTSLLLNALFSHVMQTPKDDDLPVHFLLDEIGNASRIPSFPAIVTSLRKRRCSLTLVLQDAEQLKTYGTAGSSTIINGGCASKIYLPGLPLRTCEDVSKILGQQTVIEKDRRGERRITRPL